MDGATDIAPELVIERIPAHSIGHIWSKIEGLMEDLPARSGGSWTIEGVLQKLAQNEWQLWVVHDQTAKPNIKAVVGTELWHRMSGKLCCSINFCVGEERKQWVHLLKVIEDCARESGAESIEITARKGWAKSLPDYHMTHVVLERAL